MRGKMSRRESSWRAGAMFQARESRTHSQIFPECLLCAGPVVGAGRGGGGGRSGLVPGGCVGPGLRARREAVRSGRIRVPACSRRGGDGQGRAGSCPVWSSIGMEAGAVGVGHVVGCLWGTRRIWPGGVGGVPGTWNPFLSQIHLA